MARGDVSTVLQSALKQLAAQRAVLDRQIAALGNAVRAGIDAYNSVPEASSALCLLVGLAGLAASARRS